MSIRLSNKTLRKLICEQSSSEASKNELKVSSEKTESR
jgi:hypothetical protein